VCVFSAVSLLIDTVACQAIHQVDEYETNQQSTMRISACPDL